MSFLQGSQPSMTSVFRGRPPIDTIAYAQFQEELDDRQAISTLRIGQLRVVRLVIHRDSSEEYAADYRVGIVGKLQLPKPIKFYDDPLRDTIEMVKSSTYKPRVKMQAQAEDSRRLRLGRPVEKRRLTNDDTLGPFSQSLFSDEETIDGYFPISAGPNT